MTSLEGLDLIVDDSIRDKIDLKYSRITPIEEDSYLRKNYLTNEVTLR